MGSGTPKIVPNTLGGGFTARFLVSFVACVVTEGATDGAATLDSGSRRARAFSFPDDRLPAARSFVLVVV